jgi:ABC-2 type transport system ATP-binding protein
MAGAAPPSHPAVAVRGLAKRFGDVEALRGFDLEIEAGAFYALLGPNGSGKSTSIAILTGVYEADAGEIRILGRDPDRDPLGVKARIGVVPEELMLFERLTGRQYLVFCGRMYGLSGDVSRARTEELLALTDLADAADALVAGYSKGMRRRLAIAAALVHAPELVFLDEPFEGIDVMAAGVIRDLLAELALRGVSILLTTHVLEIADKLASHAGFIQSGQMLDAGPVPALLERYGANDLEGVFETLIGVPASREARLSFFPSPEGGGQKEAG